MLIEAFAEHGVPVSLAEARVPMGLPKWDHIQALGRLPDVAGRWRAQFGRDMTSANVDASTPGSCRCSSVPSPNTRR